MYMLLAAPESDEPLYFDALQYRGCCRDVSVPLSNDAHMICGRTLSDLQGPRWVSHWPIQHMHVNNFMTIGPSRNYLNV